MAQAGLRLEEIPITFVDREYGTSKMSVKSSNSPPSGDDAAPSRAQVSLGPYMRFLPIGGTGW